MSAPDGAGPWVRRILVQRTGPDTVDADVEDRFHRFGVSVTHDGQQVTAVSGRVLRWPWSTCPDAAASLQEFAGVALDTPVPRLPRHADPAQNCTHLYDLAVVAIRHAGLGTDRRQFDVEVTANPLDEAHAILQIDGQETLRWHLRDWAIVGPEPFAGRALVGSFIAWAWEHLEPDLAEAAQLLRRAVWMAPSQDFDLDTYDRLAQMPNPVGACYSFQPERVAIATRNKGSARPPEAPAGTLLEDLEGVTP